MEVYRYMSQEPMSQVIDTNAIPTDSVPITAPTPDMQQATPEEPKNMLYGMIPTEPTQEAVEGIKFDFNDGLRVLLPKEGGPWRIQFTDVDTNVLYYDQKGDPDTIISSVKKFYTKFKLTIFHEEEYTKYVNDLENDPYISSDESRKPKPIFEHTYNAKNKLVMIQAPVHTIGDLLGWFPYVEKFRVKHQCNIIAVLKPCFIDILKAQYPEIMFITKEDTLNFRTYACYYLGLFFQGNTSHQPYDFRYVGLHRTAGHILGVDPTEERPLLNLSAPRKIEDKYVCIACMSSSMAKFWNHPSGWNRVVEFLKDNGYRVLDVDRDREFGVGFTFNRIPYGVEDYTGLKPLQERIDLIKDADFFIGLSSGLSWLAWACKIPVVMISGFTNPNNEFYTPYRVINKQVCNSCWNDMRCEFDHKDFFWCPRHKGTDQQYICSTTITPEQVIEMIKQVPTFRPKEADTSTESK